MSRQDLSALDRDMFQGPLRLIQEAMAHGILNDMIFGGLEPGQSALQEIHALPVAVQNCRIGTRRVTWDGRVFRYGQATGTLNPGFLSRSLNATQEMAWAAVAASVLAGSTTLSFIVGATDGDGSGNIAVDKLKDGYLVIFYGINNEVINMRIKGNTLGVSGRIMTLTLEEPLPIAITDAMFGEAMANPYADLRGNGDVDAFVHAVFMGLPAVAATALLPYHWTQTWGPCWLVPANGYGAVNIGNVAYANQVVAWYAGSGMIHDPATAESKYQQHIGYVLSRSQTNTQGAPFVMLQLAP